jgi:hypothetical protein
MSDGAIEIRPVKELRESIHMDSDDDLDVAEHFCMLPPSWGNGPLPQDMQTDDRESRIQTGKMMIRLFDLWGLPTVDRLNLLGLSKNSRNQLQKYRIGSVAPSTPDYLDRAGWLFSIHKSLRILFPYNKTILYSWVVFRNEDFGGERPIDVMKQGLHSIVRVAQYLENSMQQ